MQSEGRNFTPLQESSKRQPQENAGMAALLAFLHIALCGYLAFSIVYLLRNIDPALLANPKLSAELFLPVAVALFSRYGTDPLTRTLARVARGFAAATIVMTVVAMVIGSAGTKDPSNALKLVRSLGVSAICGLMMGFFVAELLRIPFVRRKRVAEVPILPLGRTLVYAVATTLITLMVWALTYPVVFDLRFSAATVAVAAVQEPLKVYLAALGVFVSAALLPFHLRMFRRRTNFAELSYPLSLHAALATLGIFGWFAAGCEWGAQSLGYELFCYAVACSLALASRSPHWSEPGHSSFIIR
ncbi:MAG: hypothetical protein N2644_02605 [Candidatus Sumerlaea chitinivorans]|nr:hypothetical protein [Candidatus Sumerlaea chitinivorans]